MCSRRRRVFDTDASQEEVYEIVAERRVALVVHGYNVCLLAYGQTGSGKTHTIFGPAGVIDDWERSNETQHGLAPRAIRDFFEGVARAPAESQFIVSLSYCEVYNDSVNDLLSGRKNLSLRETSDQRVKVDGLTSEVVSTPMEVMSALARGNASRATAAMKMNSRSSRSHAIFMLSLNELRGEGVETGKLVFVDLAGMESSKKSFSVEGPSSKAERREEAKQINTSLYALGSVIERLSASNRAGQQGAHVPYRDSKLTRLLQESLGGAACSAIVVNLRSESENLDETIGTLRFAQRAKAVPVVVRPIRSAHRSAVAENDLESVRQDLATARLVIDRLQAQLSAITSEQAEEHVRSIVKSLGGDKSTERIARLEVENRQLRHRNKALRATSVWQRLMSLRQTEVRNDLEQRDRVREDELAAQSFHLVTTRRALESAGPFAPSPSPGAAGEVAMVNTPRLVTDRILRGGGGEPAAAWGGFFSPRPQALKGRRFGMGSVSEEGRQFKRFHELATARKLALASRGYEIEGVFIEDLYNEAKRLKVPAPEWHEYLRRAVPSPSSSPTASRPGIDLSQTAPASVLGGSARGGSRGGSARGGATPRVRPQRFDMPFSSSWVSEADLHAAPPAAELPYHSARLTATELMAKSARPAVRKFSEESATSARSAPAAAPVVNARRIGAAGGAAEVIAGKGRPRFIGEAEGASLQPKHSQLVFRDGYEDWRGDMKLNSTDTLAANGVDAASVETANALRHGTCAHPNSAYALATAGVLSGAAADVRSGPAKRATSDAAKSAMRAAAASDAAREAALMASAARAQAAVRYGKSSDPPIVRYQYSVPNGTSEVSPDRSDRAPGRGVTFGSVDARAKVPLLPK